MIALALIVFTQAVCGVEDVQASQILDQIRAGKPVAYESITIKGDIEYQPPENGSNLIISPIVIFDSQIEGFVNMRNLSFKNPVYFINSRFHRDINFTDSRFYNAVAFIGCHFNDDTVDFSGCKFSRGASFTSSRFNKIINFSNATFYQRACFNNSTLGFSDFTGSRFYGLAGFVFAHFNDAAIFRLSLFNGTALFSLSKSNGIMAFEGTKFNKGVECILSEFNGIFGILDCRFDQDVNFGGSQFNNIFRVNGTNFKEGANFEGVQFNKNVKFRETKFNKYLSLNNSTFNYLDLMHNSFVNKSAIGLSGSIYYRLYIRWDSIKDHIIYDESAYMSLINNYKNMANFDDADNCYYQFRNEKRHRSPFGLSKFVDTIAWLSCGYGVRWTHTIALSFLIIILFAIIYLFKTRYINLTRSTKIPKNQPKINRPYIAITKRRPKSEFNRTLPTFRDMICDTLSFSLIILISAPRELYPRGPEKYENFINQNRGLAISERIIGWALLILLINTLSRLMIRY
jgi:hypothetical protein